jgi:hypothetical protein
LSVYITLCIVSLVGSVVSLSSARKAGVALMWGSYGTLRYR